MFTELLKQFYSGVEKHELAKAEMTTIIDDLAQRFGKTNATSVSRTGDHVSPSTARAAVCVSVCSVISCLLFGAPAHPGVEPFVQTSAKAN